MSMDPFIGNSEILCGHRRCSEPSVDKGEVRGVGEMRQEGSGGGLPGSSGLMPPLA